MELEYMEKLQFHILIIQESSLQSLAISRFHKKLHLRSMERSEL